MLRKTVVLILLILMDYSFIAAQWVQTDGPYGGTVNCFAVSGTNLFAGIQSGAVWKRSLSEMITGIKDQHKELPPGFELHQNYPIRSIPQQLLSIQFQKLLL